MEERDVKHVKVPGDFTMRAFGSVWQNWEHEVIVTNIMTILERTGNEWRELSWDEYKSERLKDGHFTESEKPIFEKVVSYCVSAETAKLVCDKWKEAYDKE